jgi:hypothetical protein
MYYCFTFYLHVYSCLWYCIIFGKRSCKEAGRYNVLFVCTRRQLASRMRVGCEHSVGIFLKYCFE